MFSVGVNMYLVESVKLFTSTSIYVSNSAQIHCIAFVPKFWEIRYVISNLASRRILAAEQ